MIVTHGSLPDSNNSDARGKVPFFFHLMHALPLTQLELDTNGSILSATLK